MIDYYWQKLNFKQLQMVKRMSQNATYLFRNAHIIFGNLTSRVYIFWLVITITTITKKNVMMAIIINQL